MKRQRRFGKQFLVIAAVLVMTLSVLTGCAGAEPPPAQPPPAQTTSAETTPATAESALPSIRIVDAPEKMGVGDRLVLHAEVANADSAAVQWTVSDSAIAQVAEDGTVVAVKEGTVTVTAQVADVTDSAELSVLPHIREIALEETDVKLLLGTPGASHAVAYRVAPANALEPGVQWTSSAPDIVSVDEAGNLTALAVGSCTVTGKALDTANQVAEVTLNVTVDLGVSQITLSETELTGYVGKSVKLTAEVAPQDAANRNLVWTSSDEAIATVDGTGSVRFLQPGQVTVTCSAADGGGTEAQCALSVVQGTTKVALSSKQIQLVVGGKASAAQTTLTCTVTPADTSFPDVTWTSSDETVATVDAQGNVTALAAGKVTITAISTDPATNGKVKDTASVVVGEAVQKITLNDLGKTLILGKSYTLKPTLTPAKPLNGKLEWTSSDETVLTVDNKGKITVVGLGSATVTATATDGSDVSASVSFTAIQPVKKISSASSRIVITKGKTFTASVTVEPANATYKTVLWSSSDPSIASVDEKGVITANAVGRCNIIVTSQDGSNVTKKIPVVVEPVVTVDATTFTRSGYFGYYTEFAVTFKNLTATKTITRIDFHLKYSVSGSTRTSYCYTGNSIMSPLGPGATRKIGWWQESGLTWGSNFMIYLDSVTYKDGTKDYFYDELIGWFY